RGRAVDLEGKRRTFLPFLTPFRRSFCAGKMRTPVAPVSLLPVLAFALVLAGCSTLSKLVAEGQPATSAAPAAMTDASSPSLQWYFAKRADEEQTSKAAQEPRRTVAAAPPAQDPPPS